jgi:hypothetical protein
MHINSLAVILMTAGVDWVHRTELPSALGPRGAPPKGWRLAWAKWTLAALIFSAAGLALGSLSPFSRSHAPGSGDMSLDNSVDRGSDSKLSPFEETRRSPPIHDIYADTAMGPVSYPEEGHCRDHIRMIAEKISSSHRMIVNPRPSGIYYIGFDGQDDNYVLRCFKIDQTDYRLFISAAGTDKQEVALGLGMLFAAAGEPAE